MNTTFLRNNRPIESRMSTCPRTGQARFRDRHQARDSIRAMSRTKRRTELRPYPCVDCKGFHIDELRAPFELTRGPHEVTTADPELMASRKRRYFLIDIENLTHGANATRAEVRQLFRVLKEQAPGITPHDHVVIAASRYVVRKYRYAIVSPNVKWIIGDAGVDGADKALLNAIDLRRVARDFDELVIMSGDGVFAALAKSAKKAGMSTQVVTVQHVKGWRTLSQKLSTTCDTHTRIRLAPHARAGLSAISAA